MLPESNEAKRVKCAVCGVQVDVRLFRYAYVRIGWRGQSEGTERQREYSTGRAAYNKRRALDQEFCLCGPCGDELHREVELFLLGRGLIGRGVHVD